MNKPASVPQEIMEPVIYLLDADPRVMEGLSHVLASEGLRCVGSTTVEEFFNRFQPDRLGCLVLDLALGDAGGLVIQQEICARGITLPVVFLSGAVDISKAVEAMKAGALDFLLKPVDCDALLAAVRAGIALDLVRRAEATDERHLRKKLETLSVREREVLPYLVSGMLNKQIAAELNVVEKTIKVHRAHVMAKIGARSLPELVRFTDRMRIEPPRRLNASISVRPASPSPATVPSPTFGRV